MSALLPDKVDAWRMVAGRRCFEGELPLAAMPRLASMLASDEGSCRYVIEFGRDEVGIDYADVRAGAGLTLTCQRTLQPFVHPVDVRQRLGLLRHEDDEAGLPGEYEAVLVPEDGGLNLQALIEDELILAIPAVPVAPGTMAVAQEWSPPQREQDASNPFAALAALKGGDGDRH